MISQANSNFSLHPLSLMDSLAYCSSSPPVCPLGPVIPPFPSAASSPMSSVSLKIDEFFNRTVSLELGIKEAIEENHLPILGYWLQKTDDELAQHFSPSDTDRFAIKFDRCQLIESHFEKLIIQSAEKGNIPVVTALLNRFSNFQKTCYFGYHVTTVIKHALNRGQKNLILALLRKGYGSFHCSGALADLLWTNPKIALELAGENLCLTALKEGVATAIRNDQPEILCALLNRPEENTLLPFAAETAVKNNKMEVLKEVLRRGLSENEMDGLLNLAIDQGKIEAAHLLASQTFVLNDSELTWKLFQTGYFPSRFSLSMIQGLNSDQTLSLLEAYIRSGQISGQDLIDAWPKDEFSFSILFRLCLVDRFPLADEFRRFLTDQFIHFSSKTQELIIRIAILRDQPDFWIDTLISSALLSDEKKGHLSLISTTRFEAQKQIRSHVGQKPIIPLWNEEEVQRSILERGPEILDWSKEKRDNPEYVYFTSSTGVIGQIQSLPHLVLKSLYSSRAAAERITRIEEMRTVCQEKHLNHLRVPNALLISSLKDRDGTNVPIHLVIEEKLPIASHSIVKNKELLEELNRESETRKMVNSYFSELTSLVCRTGLSDLKANNVPLLEDGSGIGIVDSSQQGYFANALYTFQKEGYALIDWLAPINFQALRKTLDKDPDCRKALTIDPIPYEKRRETSYAKERELSRQYVSSYGLQDEEDYLDLIHS